ncbi:acyl-CoA carboxylase subunit epsilon [Planomonospora sp. ID82291]|uniref:acyl-CoA carboxylase subunit epsilon n=1 Tax=Planomonospora sp. ID82291 TaxID=2738136 RepID=UPI0018C3A613|nr:acyl-CoA carboxylase subunit epsilon [Planomonospora sp. ID82291]
MTHLKIVRGDATAEEVAALILALAARSTSPVKVTQKSENWRNPAHRMRKAFPFGQGAWRSSGLPR